MKLLLNGSFGRALLGAFQELWVYRKIFKDISREQDVLFFLGIRFLANFVGFIVFSFTLGHNFPYPKSIF